jgi:hypothetical protein
MGVGPFAQGIRCVGLVTDEPARKAAPRRRRTTLRPETPANDFGLCKCPPHHQLTRVGIERHALRGRLLVYPTLVEAVIAPSAFLATVTVESQFLTPVLMARKLELNPFAVFLAIAFCTWMWGPLGAFLAVPVLICLSRSRWATLFNEDHPDDVLRSAV